MEIRSAAHFVDINLVLLDSYIDTCTVLFRTCVPLVGRAPVFIDDYFKSFPPIFTKWLFVFSTIPGGEPERVVYEALLVFYPIYSKENLYFAVRGIIYANLADCSSHLWRETTGDY